MQDTELGNQADKTDNSSLNEEQQPCSKDKKESEHAAKPFEEVGQGAVKTVEEAGQKVAAGSIISNPNGKVDETTYANWTNAKKEKNEEIESKKEEGRRS